MSNWQTFRAHHLAEATQLTRRGKDRIRLIARAWRLVGNSGHKAAEVAAISNGNGRTLQAILNGTAQAAPALAPVPPPAAQPPAPALPPPSLTQHVGLAPQHINSAPAGPAIPGVPGAMTTTTPTDGNATIFGILSGFEDPIEELPSSEERENDEAAAWVGGHSLGGRDPNKASLWLHYNEHNQLDDRRVIKDCYVQADRWVDYTKWHGDVTDWNSRVPLEYVIQRRLNDTDGGHLFAEVQAWAVYNEYQMFRLMHPYYDQGDAGGFAKRCAEDGARVPEPFLWFLLEYLTDAGSVMDLGSLATPVNNWLQIVHRDLKPDNVFLSSHPDHAYPVPKVADFEFAIETSLTDKHNPHIHRHLATGHYVCQAPEGVPDADSNDTLLNERILSPANVWCIGITLFALMNKGRAKDSGADWYTEQTPDWHPAALEEYSEDLQKVVTYCLEKLPEERISIRGLNAYVRTRQLSAQAETAREARAAALATDLPEHWRYKPQAEQYRLGLAWDAGEETETA